MKGGYEYRPKEEDAEDNPALSCILALPFLADTRALTYMLYACSRVRSGRVPRVGMCIAYSCLKFNAAAIDVNASHSKLWLGR